MFNKDNVNLYQWEELYFFENEIATCFASLKRTITFHSNMVFEEKQKSSNYKFSKFYLSLDEESRIHFESQFYDSEKSAIETMKYVIGICNF